MSDRIKVTCNHCNNIIKAPRSAAGRRGICPHCKNTVYVPTPPEELEDIPLAPLDGEDEVRDREQEREASEANSALLSERAAADAGSGGGEPAVSGSGADHSSGDVAEEIISYLLAMQSSDLAKAERIVRQLKKSAGQARSKVQQFMVDAMPPGPLRNMADGLYQGFLRKLLEQLK